MKIWKYIHADMNGNIADGEWVKSTFLYQENTPTDPDYVDITTPELRKAYIRDQYRQRTVDGDDYFQKLRENWAFDVEEGNLMEFEVFEIESLLANVITCLQRGDWKTAQNSMFIITPTFAYTQAMHDSILAYVDDYILNNY